MKLSIEAKVAAAVALAFAALSMGAIAQEQSEHRSAGLGQISPQGAKISLVTQSRSGTASFAPNIKDGGGSP